MTLAFHSYLHGQNEFTNVDNQLTVTTPCHFIYSCRRLRNLGILFCNVVSKSPPTLRILNQLRVLLLFHANILGSKVEKALPNQVHVPIRVLCVNIR